MAKMTPQEWDACYAEQATPWDTGVPSRELVRTLQDLNLHAGRALELGCGTGTNAVWMVQSGLQVTAIDLAPRAIALAGQKAERAGVRIELIAGDVCQFAPPEPTFDFLFDRGCYHCVRRFNLAGYFEAVRRALRPGGRALVLAGNADEQGEGPPRVTAAELCAEFEPLLRIDRLHAFRFDDPGGATGPLAWSCLMTRR